jgi:hypothetical protein
MITLGMLIGALVKGNPGVIVMATKKIEAGSAVEVTSIKISETKEKDQIIVLTI